MMLGQGRPKKDAQQNAPKTHANTITLAARELMIPPSQRPPISVSCGGTTRSLKPLDSCGSEVARLERERLVALDPP